MKEIFASLSFFNAVFMSSACYGVFSGQWGGQGKNNDGTLYSTLTLKLEQNGNQVVGTYCYVTRNGKKIDCPEDGNKNITGTAKGNQAKVFFNTGLGRGKGSANLIREGNTVAWLLNESASEDVVYAPLKYTLIKVNSSYTEAQMKTFSTPGFTVVLLNRCGGGSVFATGLSTSTSEIMMKNKLSFQGKPLIRNSREKS